MRAADDTPRATRNAIHVRVHVHIGGVASFAQVRHRAGASTAAIPCMGGPCVPCADVGPAGDRGRPLPLPQGKEATSLVARQSCCFPQRGPRRRKSTLKKVHVQGKDRVQNHVEGIPHMRVRATPRQTCVRETRY